MNSLSKSKSLYLQQHSKNPVNWVEWSDAAFESARERDCPVLLSIGYSTCHWCHVMEHESFEDAEIAEFMNANYVCIKVDREERPDVDSIYMTCVQMLNGHGGWPMTLWLTADRKPFFGGTYFPARDGDRGQGTGFLTLLGRLREVYNSQKARVLESADHIYDLIAKAVSAAGEVVSTDAAKFQEYLQQYRLQVERRYDPVYGGAKGQPKFPSSFPVRFALRQDTTFRGMAEQTLVKMARGGIYDQVGGLFHRYSVDGEWHVPHFEKMLYDNAFLLSAYCEGALVSRNPELDFVARDLADSVLKDFLLPTGVFASAWDADSESEIGESLEGAYFLWTESEVKAVCGADFADFAKVIRLEDAEHGKCVLVRKGGPADFDSEVWSAFLRCREKIASARAARKLPARDEKCMTDWNSYMISALSLAGTLLDAPQYLEAALNAAEVLSARFEKAGRIFHTDSNASIGFLEDTSAWALACLNLFEATGEGKWLNEAVRVEERVEAEFSDPVTGLCFRTRDETKLPRQRPLHDGAEPSGNALMIQVWLKLSHLTGEATYESKAKWAFESLASEFESNLASFAETMSALDAWLVPGREIVVVSDTPVEWKKTLWSLFNPRDLYVFANSASSDVGLLRGRISNRNAVFICQGGTCQRPITDPTELKTALTQL